MNAQTGTELTQANQLNRINQSRPRFTKSNRYIELRGGEEEEDTSDLFDLVAIIALLSPADSKLFLVLIFVMSLWEIVMKRMQTRAFLI